MVQILKTVGKTLMYSSVSLTCLFALFDLELMGEGVKITSFYYVFMFTLFSIGFLTYKNRESWGRFLS